MQPIYSNNFAETHQVCLVVLARVKRVCLNIICSEIIAYMIYVHSWCVSEAQ